MKKVLAVVVMCVASVAFAKGGGGHSSGHSSSHSSSSHTSTAKPAPFVAPVAPVRTPTPVRSGGGTHTEEQCKKEKKC